MVHRMEQAGRIQTLAGQLAKAVAYIDYISADRVRDMTLNNWMVRLHQCWSFGGCSLPFHCHRSKVHSGPEW